MKELNHVVPLGQHLSLGLSGSVGLSPRNTRLSGPEFFHVCLDLAETHVGVGVASPLNRLFAKVGLEDGIIVHRKIVNVSSINAWGAVGQINYSAAKMGILGLTKAVAKEWASFNIHCNAICFGGVQTRLIGSKDAGEKVLGFAVGVPQSTIDARNAAAHGRLPATPREAASGIFYLASPLSDYVNGDVITVDNGHHRM